jgi:hypothetical protein
VINEIESDCSDRAKPAMVERGVPVAFYLDELSIFDMEQNAATAVTTAAYAFEYRTLPLHLATPGARV